MKRQINIRGDATALSWLLELVVTCVVFSTCPSIASDDLQSWSSMTLEAFQYGELNGSLYGEARIFDNVSDPGLFLIGPKLSYRVNRYINLGLNYTYFQFKKIDQTSDKERFHYQHRAEFEINPHWLVFDWLKLNTRNRLEFRWIEGLESPNIRSRHRIELEFPIRNAKLVKSLYTNNEFFHDYSNREHSENRLTPIGINLDLNGRASLKLFYLIQSRKIESWKNAHVIGTHVAISF